ncbi:unnamed protein product [Protopolystoma xenopodis]|uniref:Uncharacterized protein n=1 Tax=Protopolystoma xenopodis TaxID=117903 RepID=A0A3S5AQN3_9PLAT|nr:unnamed protein product [Protopolystoma xenopodis]
MTPSHAWSSGGVASGDTIQCRIVLEARRDRGPSSMRKFSRRHGRVNCYCNASSTRFLIGTFGHQHLPHFQRTNLSPFLIQSGPDIVRDYSSYWT